MNDTVAPAPASIDIFQDGKLDWLATAYRTGRDVPFEIEHDSNNDPYWGLVQAAQTARVPLDERLVFHRCRRTVAEALRRARRRQMASAAHQFDEVRSLIEVGLRHEESRLLGRAILLASQAYCTYKDGEYGEARRQIQEAMSLDLHLENDCGYGILHLHRLTLISNLARIATRERGLEHGVGPLVALLLYLEGARPELDMLAPSNVRLAELPAGMLREMMFGFASELAVLLARLTPSQTASVGPIVEPLARERDTPRFQVRIAGAFQVLGAHGGMPDLGDGSALLSALAAGRPGAPRLWYALVVELERRLAEARCGKSQQFCREILGDAAAWPDLPPVLRTALAPLPL